MIAQCDALDIIFSVISCVCNYLLLQLLLLRYVITLRRIVVFAVFVQGGFVSD